MGHGVSTNLKALPAQLLTAQSPKKSAFPLFSNWNAKSVKALASGSHVKETYAPYCDKKSSNKTQRAARSPTRIRLPLLRRSNSSNSFFVNSTMRALDQSALLICVSAVMRSHAQVWVPTFDRTPMSKMSKCFLDENVPKTVGEVPSTKDFQGFLSFIYTGAQLEPEVMIIGLIYYERILLALDNTFKVCRNTWRPLVLISLVLASKMFDDLSMINADFAVVCNQHFPLRQINQLETYVVLLLRFSLNVQTTQYAKYYFNLRAMLGRDIILRDAQKPLGMGDALRLQNVPGTYAELKLTQELRSCRARRCNTLAGPDDDLNLAAIGIMGNGMNLEQVTH